MRRSLLALLLVAACGTTNGPPTTRDELARVYGWNGGPGERHAIEWIEARPELRRRLFEPRTAALARLLRNDYGIPFHPRDAGELVAWAFDSAVRRDLEDPAVRAFARARLASGAMNGDVLRFRGTRLWTDAVRIFAAIARRPRTGPLLDDLHRLYDYRLQVVDGPGLVRLTEDAALRSRLLDEGVAAGWRQFAKPSKARFTPGAARSVVVLAAHPDDGEIVQDLRLKYRIRVSRPSSLADLAALAERDGGLAPLVDDRHAKLLAALAELLPRRLETAELAGTLRLAKDERFDARVVEEAARAGWRPVFDSASVDTLLRIAGDEPLRARLASWRPPPDVGRRGAPRSLAALVAAATGALDPLDAWLEPGDRAFRDRLPDARAHADLVADVLARRGDRRTVHRPDATYDATGRTLHKMNRVDLLKILALQRALEDPAFRARLDEEVRADVADETTERGGLIALEGDGRLRLETDVLAGAGDGAHRLSHRPDPTRAFATWHVHALGGERYAGPSLGPVSDLASARRLGMDGVVVTPVDGGIDVDYHDTTRGVFDLGVFGVR